MKFMYAAAACWTLFTSMSTAQVAGSRAAADAISRSQNAAIEQDIAYRNAFLVFGYNPQDKPEYAKAKDSWKTQEAKRREKIQQHKDDLTAKIDTEKSTLKDLQEEARKAKNSIYYDPPKKAAERKQKIQDQETKINKIKAEIASLDKRPDSKVDLSEISVGDVGRFDGILTVINVTSDGVLVKWGYKNYWLDLPAQEKDKLVDGKTIKTDGLIHCYGTKSYTTLKAKATVHSIRIIR